MKVLKFVILIIMLGVFLNPKSDAQEMNLIPNPNFEVFDGVPLGWFYNGSQFTRVMKYWYSPTLASPDIFGPGVIVPSHWKKKGFGNVDPFDGLSMIGITLYGCSEGKPHCREYVQIQLMESLVPGQNYILKYKVSHLAGSLFVDKLGALFSMDAFKENTDGLLEMEPQIYSEKIIKPSPEKWVEMKHSFVLDSAFNYITIGNFFDDSENRVDSTDHVFEYAYYYLDQIELRKVPPIIEQELPPDDLSKLELSVGKTIQLKNIYFDLDKSDLLPRSFQELNKLVKILEENPGMRIEVHGHTDIQGESDYNIELSNQRAESVGNYLISSDIDPSRIDYKGFGSDIPIADNSNEAGRKLNRRVEILITAL